MVKAGRGSGGAPKNEGKKNAHRHRRAPPGADGRTIDPRIQTEIGKHLRAIYDDVINEPVPDQVHGAPGEARAIDDAEELRSVIDDRLEGPAGRPARVDPQSARLRRLARRQQRARRRSRAGNADEGVGEVRHVPGGHQPPRLALHHPAQRVLLAGAQARPRGRGRGGHLRRPARLAAGADRPHGHERFPRSARRSCRPTSARR